MSLSAVGAWLRDRPLVVDSGIAAVLLVAGVAAMLVGSGYAGTRDADGVGYVLAIAATAPIALRRVAPLPVLAVVSVAHAVSTSMAYVAGVSGVSVLMGVYTLAAYRDRREALLGLVVGTSAFLSSIPFVDATIQAVDVVAVLGVVLAAYAFGRSIGFRRAYTAELELRADRLERARESDLRAVLAEERGRIARELHDVVAHHVSVMTVQASAAQRTLDRDKELSREAMAAVEHTGRQALVEMRRIVGVLRADGDETTELAPQPGVDDLCALVDSVKEAGLPTEVSIVGSPRPLPSGVDLTVYRLVQEALTNTLKHAGPTSATVTLTYGAGFVHVNVRDSGCGAASSLTATERRPRGHGLLGMRERVTLYGGSLRAGPGPGGGYDVSARIPVEQGSS